MGAPQAQAQGQVSAQHTCGCRGGLWPGLTSGGACRAKSAGACCRLCQSLRAPGLGPACSVCPLQTPCVSWLSLTELPFPSHTPRPIQPPPSLQSFPTSFSPRLLQTPTHGPACRCPGGQGPGSTLRSNGARYACTRWTGRRQVPGPSCSPGPRAEHAPRGGHGRRPQTASVTEPDGTCVCGWGPCGGCRPPGKLALFPILPCLPCLLYFPLQFDCHLEKISSTSKFSALPTKMQAPRKQKTLSVFLSVLNPWRTGRGLACGRCSVSIC